MGKKLVKEMRSKSWGFFQKVSSVFLINWLKQRMIANRYSDMSEEENNHLDGIKRQNPFGIMVLVLGGASFAFGPEYKSIPIFTMLFCLATIGTFDKEKEDNPWTFIIGFGLSVIGLYMYLNKVYHSDYLY